MKALLNILFATILSLTLSSCDKQRVYENNIYIPKQGWHKDSILIFEVEVSDTINPNNVYINMRNNGNYRYSNIFLFLTTRIPDGKFATDTLELRLADADGKWLGAGYGGLFDNQILFMRNVRFAQTGTYCFEIQQAMRIDILEDITDVGMRIEIAKQ